MEMVNMWEQLIQQEMALNPGMDKWTAEKSVSKDARLTMLLNKKIEEFIAKIKKAFPGVEVTVKFHSGEFGDDLMIHISGLSNNFSSMSLMYFADRHHSDKERIEHLSRVEKKVLDDINSFLSHKKLI